MPVSLVYASFLAVVVGLTKLDRERKKVEATMDFVGVFCETLENLALFAHGRWLVRQRRLDPIRPGQLRARKERITEFLHDDDFKQVFVIEMGSIGDGINGSDVVNWRCAHDGGIVEMPETQLRAEFKRVSDVF